MAPTFDSMRLRHERQMDRQFAAEQRQLAQQIGRLVRAAATTTNEAGAPAIPESRAARDRLETAIWQRVLKPYYIGMGDDPFDGMQPRSRFAQLLMVGIEGATRIQVERQVALLRQTLRSYPDVLDFLTGPRPPDLTTEQRVYDPFHRFVDPNGYRLSDRVWRDAIDVRSRVDRLLAYHIPRGTSAVEVADLLEEFLTPGAGTQRTLRPYGREGSYAARRLARTEISAAAGRATVNAGEANPFVEGMRWALSQAHPCCDICDDYARGGPNGDGVYPLDQVPTFVPHPNCMCRLEPVSTTDTRGLALALRDQVRVRGEAARQMQGLFNVAWLTGAILSGAFNEWFARNARALARAERREEELAA